MAIALAAAGAVFIAYGVSIFLIWSGSNFYAVWFALGAACLAAAWVVHAGWWASLPAFARRLVAGVVCAALAVCAVTQGLALSCFGMQGDDDLDCLVVLGAQVRDDGPSIVLGYRLAAAADYLEAHPQTRCIVSGGQGSNEPEPEARVMARYLVERGVDEGRITVEDESTNTVGNIRNSMKFLDAQNERVGIVTNNFHLFRGMAIARKQGIAHVSGIAARSDAWYLPNNLFRETFGIAKDFVQGNL